MGGHSPSAPPPPPSYASAHPTSGAISPCEVASLDHEILDNSVELAAFVAKPFLSMSDLKEKNIKR